MQKKIKLNILENQASKLLFITQKQRYIIDLTEIQIKLKSNTKYNYLFNIIDHFSKFDISIPVENKDAKTILNS